MKFEYDVLVNQGGSRVTVDTLNEKGAEGWELITIYNGENGHYHYLFKRVVKVAKAPKLKEVK